MNENDTLITLRRNKKQTYCVSFRDFSGETLFQKSKVELKGIDQFLENGFKLYKSAVSVTLDKEK